MDPIPRRRQWRPIFSFYDSPDAWYEFKGGRQVRTSRKQQYDQQMNNFGKAEVQFKRVIELGGDPELAARACVLVQTSRNQYLYHQVVPDATTHEYFYLLGKRYQNTAFYKSFVEKCPPAKLFR